MIPKGVIKFEVSQKPGIIHHYCGIRIKSRLYMFSNPLECSSEKSGIMAQWRSSKKTTNQKHTTMNRDDNKIHIPKHTDDAMAF